MFILQFVVMAMKTVHPAPSTIVKALTVDIVRQEIVFHNSLTSSASLTPAAAGETAKRLVEAADKLQRR